MEEKIFEIVTPEGAIVTVNTEEQNGKYYGDTWSEICQSKLYGKPLLATIKGYQYPKNADMTTGNKPVGYIVNMDENIDLRQIATWVKSNLCLVPFTALWIPNVILKGA